MCHRDVALARRYVENRHLGTTEIELVYRWHNATPGGALCTGSRKVAL